jgi:hypothetical protein
MTGSLADELAAVHSAWLERGRQNLIRAANDWRRTHGLEPFDNAASCDTEGRDGCLLPRVLPAFDAMPSIEPRCGDPAEVVFEAATILRAQREGAAILREYVGQFGWIFNADTMSELLDVHTEARRWAWHDAVRSTASALTQAAFDGSVASPADPHDVVVLFTGGGNGSGKSTFAGVGMPGCFGLDSTLSDFDSSRRNIDKVLTSGRAAAVTFIYRAPEDAYVHGVLPRGADPANGRSVPLPTHGRTHARAPCTADALARTYESEPGFRLLVIENRTGELPRLRSLAWLRTKGDRQRDEHSIRRRIEQLLS